MNIESINKYRELLIQDRIKFTNMAVPTKNIKIIGMFVFHLFSLILMDFSKKPEYMLAESSSDCGKG